MDKKGHLLNNLKRQVLALKTQLQRLQKHREPRPHKDPYNSKNNRSASYSSRFDSLSLDCSYLDKGIRKFNSHKYQFKNIAELIHEKSRLDRKPVSSVQRRAENQRTKNNFSSEGLQHSKTRSKSPNPVTGEGYSEKKVGRKTDYQPRKEVQVRPSNKKHFNLYQ